MRKSDLPTKPCARCGLPMVWRKKWARVWDEVRYCSDRCRSARSFDGRAAADPAASGQRQGPPQAAGSPAARRGRRNH